MNPSQILINPKSSFLEKEEKLLLGLQCNNLNGL